MKIKLISFGTVNNWVGSESIKSQSVGETKNDDETKWICHSFLALNLLRN